MAREAAATGFELDQESRSRKEGRTKQKVLFLSMKDWVCEIIVKATETIRIKETEWGFEVQTAQIGRQKGTWVVLEKRSKLDIKV